MFCLLSAICRNGALAGINFLFEITPEFVCGCVRWKMYVWSVLKRGWMAGPQGPGERAGVEMS